MSHKVDCKKNTITITMAKGKELSKETLTKAFKIQPRYKIQKLAAVESTEKSS